MLSKLASFAHSVPSQRCLEGSRLPHYPATGYEGCLLAFRRPLIGGVSHPVPNHLDRQFELCAEVPEADEAARLQLIDDEIGEPADSRYSSSRFSTRLE